MECQKSLINEWKANQRTFATHKSMATLNVACFTKFYSRSRKGMDEQGDQGYGMSGKSEQSTVIHCFK